MAIRAQCVSFGLLFALQTVLAVDFPSQVPSPAAIAPAPARHKLLVTDPAVAARIAARGGRLIADYGSYQLYEAANVPPTLATNRHVEFRDHYNRILLNAAPLDTSLPQAAALRQSVGSFAGKNLHLIHFAGPILPAWRAQLEKTGVRIVSYVPHNAYLVYGDSSAIARLQHLASSAPHVQWDGACLPDYKIHPAARTTDAQGRARAVGTDWFAVQLVADAAANPATLQLLDRLKLEPFHQQRALTNYVNLVARLHPQDLNLLAAQPEVVSIQPYFPRKPFCERQDQIVAGNLTNDVPSGPGYLAWLASKGFTQDQFTASGFIVDVSDSGIDNGTTTPNHFGLFIGGNVTNASRVAYNRLEGSANNGSTLAGCDGHGTLNTHIISGYDDLPGFPFADVSGYHYGLGVCPFVMVGSSVIFDPYSFTFPNYAVLQSDAYQNGARISNNSWGGRASGAYDVDCQAYDALVRDAQPGGSDFPTPGNQEMVIVFAAGNDGPGAGTIGSPGAAKNVITVGASDNVQPFGGPDGSGIADSAASSANDMTFFSSRGPCEDGRHKPDLVAPGTHVSGGVAQAPAPGPDGTANSCFDGSGISGGPSSSSYFPFFPDAQQFYSASSGTSHSTPCVVGGCALVRQWFINNFTNPPSPAMTKAFLMNSTRYLNGAYANDNLWSDVQGMGEMNLGTAFDGVSRVFRDELPEDLFTASGQTRVFTGRISDTNQPFRVTVAWTDAPGNTVGDAFNNDLDLTVTVGGNTYKGNVFSGRWSVTGGVADVANNVETVLLPPGADGIYSVTITAANINSDGVPNNTNALDQDFALVIYNAVSAPEPSIVPGGTALLIETCQPTNGAVDPGETVTVNFSLQNVGSSPTTNLVATLQADTNVLSPSGPQSYGVLPPGGTAVDRAFTFTAGGACGQNLTVTMKLTDGSANLSDVTFSLPLGRFVPATTFTENFDSVGAPDLPANWTSSANNGQSPWTTVTDNTDTPPNSVFVPAPNFSSTSDLYSPSIAIASPNAQLTFMQYYNLEADPDATNIAYDGGVLEISINDDPFQDIIEAGGSFVTNGYTRRIDFSDDNPFDGQSVWSGNSGGFIQTVVNLPPTAAGQNVQFRWRLGTDSGNYFGSVGWWIDSVSLWDGYYTCCTASGAPAVIVAPTNQTLLPGRTATFQVMATGAAPLAYQWTLNGTNVPGATDDMLTLTNVQPDMTGPCTVTITNASGSAMASANLTVSVPSVGAIQVTSTNVVVPVSSISGATYTLEYKNALTDPVWIPIVPSLPGTGSTIYLQDTNPPAPTRFYRILTE